jgi:hypothetical protein
VPFNLTLLDFINNQRSADTFVVMCRDEREEIAEKSGMESRKGREETE